MMETKTVTVDQILKALHAASNAADEMLDSCLSSAEARQRAGDLFEAWKESSNCAERIRVIAECNL